MENGPVRDADVAGQAAGDQAHPPEGPTNLIRLQPEEPTNLIRQQSPGAPEPRQPESSEPRQPETAGPRQPDAAEPRAAQPAAGPRLTRAGLPARIPRTDATEEELKEAFARSWEPSPDYQPPSPTPFIPTQAGPASTPASAPAAPEPPARSEPEPLAPSGTEPQAAQSSAGDGPRASRATEFLRSTAAARDLFAGR